MKTGLRYLTIAVLAFAFASCKDKAAEKKIAELESRLAQLEGNKSATPTPAAATVTPTTPVTPEEKPEGPLPVLEFDNIDYDFGTVVEGQKVIHVYKVTNTGKAPLLIQNAQPSCGCTVPDWTKAPIPAGGTGFVKAEFDTKGKQGINNKVITVTANTWPKTTQLKFKAMVTPKADGGNGPVK